MVCSRSTDDPIARLVNKQDGFVILDRGYAPAELFPGLVLRKPFESSKRPSVPVKAATMISGWPELVPAVSEYRRLARNKVRSNISAGAAASVSGVLTGDPGGAAEIATELNRASVSNLDVSLNGAVVRYVDVAKLENALPECTVTELGARYRDRADRLFVVYETLNVTGATLTLDESASVSSFISAMATVLGKLGLKASAEGSADRAVVLDRGNGSEIVIAVRALEIDWSEPTNLFLSSPPSKWPFRGRDGQDTDAPEDADIPTLEELSRSYTVAGLSDLGSGDELLVRFDAEV